MDYSQYIPRSHYNQTARLKAYFKTQMWYGLATFRSEYEDEVRSAVLQTSALKNKENEKGWYALFDPITFFVGECDDITFYQYEQALKDVYGEDLANTAAVTDPEKFKKALAVIQKLEGPQINSIPVFEASKQPDIEKAITGFRFLGQRFTIDAAVFQQLMDRKTEGRMLPKALDIPAAFGSEEAVKILKDEGEMQAYPAYEKNLAEMQDYLSKLNDDTWTSNLYWSWLYMLHPLAGNDATAGLPLFMQGDAWVRKSLNTFEGSWTELKHDTLLYAKQPMAEMGAGGEEAPPPPDDRGYVEPAPDVFGRLASLVGMTLDGLASRDLLTDEAKESLGVLKKLANGLTKIAEKELADKPLTDQEYELIRTYGGELEHIWTTAKRDELKDVSPMDYLYMHPCAIVADVATDPNGEVLEEATGYAKTIYVAFPRDGKVVLGRGAVYSQYEFTVPLDQRMTDETWHVKLTSGEEPKVADWKKAYLAKAGKSQYAQN
jgi:hypothetical protein